MALYSHLATGRTQHLERGVYIGNQRRRPTLRALNAGAARHGPVADGDLVRHMQGQLSRDISRQEDITMRHFTALHSRPMIYKQGSDTYQPLVSFDQIGPSLRNSVIQGTLSRPLPTEDTYTRFRGPGQSPFHHPHGIPGQRHAWRPAQRMPNARAFTANHFIR